MEVRLWKVEAGFVEECAAGVSGWVDLGRG
jgi:hypothetical protein